MSQKQFSLFDQEPDDGDPQLENESASQNPRNEDHPVPVPSNSAIPLPASAIERAEALRELSYQLKFKNG